MRPILPEDSLLSAQEAISLFVSKVPPERRIKEIEITDALNKISAEDVYSPIDLPPFSRSTVDGFAVKSSFTPGKFKIIGKINIGEYKKIEISDNEAVEVDTGAMIPKGADAVIKIEETKIEGEYVEIPKKLNFGTNIAWIGSDMPRGTQILYKGEKITPEKIAFLASAGIGKVKVYEPPSVYVISTGDELIEPGKELQPGKIYESNLHFLISRLKNDGYNVVGHKVVGDDKDKIEEALEEASEIADVIIITGGTSAGEKDLVHQIIREKGEIIVHGLKFKPGKPTLLGKFKGKPVFGLPGNIVSTIMIYDRVIRNYLSLMKGEENTTEETEYAQLLLPVKADKKRFTYIPVYLVQGFAIPIPFDSYMVGSFSLADGFIGLEPGTELKEGDKVEVIIKRKDMRITLIGEEDKRFDNLNVRKIYLGSQVSCKALEKGIGDIVVVSSLFCTPNNYDYLIERRILEQGEGDEVGYFDWLGLSKFNRNPSVKLKSPSTVLNFLGKAKVFAPEGYLKEGKELGKEKLFVIVRNKEAFKFLNGIF
ncbi:MAG: molybdopterin-binding protein [Acidianus hospitalis]